MKFYNNDHSCSKCLNLKKLNSKLKYMRSVRRTLIYLTLATLVGYAIGDIFKAMLTKGSFFYDFSWPGLVGAIVAIGILATYLRHELIGIRIFAFFDKNMRLHVHATRPASSIISWKGMRVADRWHRPSNKHDCMITSHDFVNGSYFELVLGGPLRLFRNHSIHGEHFTHWTVFRANNLNDIIVRDRTGGMIGGLSIGDLLVVINENEEVIRYFEGITILQAQLEKLGHATAATIHYLMGGKGKTPSKMAAKGREMLSAAMRSLTFGDVNEINRWNRHAPDVSERFIAELERCPSAKDNPDYPKPELSFPNVFKRL